MQNTADPLTIGNVAICSQQYLADIGVIQHKAVEIRQERIRVDLGISGVKAAHFGQAIRHLVLQLLQKIGHVLIVDVKCAAVNIRTFRQLPNRNMLLRLLAHQLHESQAQLPFRFLHSAVNIFSRHSQRSLLYYKQFA